MRKNMDNMPAEAGLTHIEECVDMYIPRIMIVGDEDFLVRMLERELAEKDYELDQARTFEEAIAKLAENTYRLIFADLEVNGQDATGFLIFCRRKYKNCDVVLLAAKSQMKSAVEAIRNGAAHVLSKPINLQELLFQLKERLEAPKIDLDFETSGLSLPSGCELIRKIGEGSVCSVYLVARDGVLMAMKIPKSDNWSQERLKRFFREADVLAKIAHPNIVSIFEYGVSDCEEIPYILMEYLPGGSLETFARANAISLEAGVNIMIQLLSAMSEVHGHGLLHRDVKPRNILISETGEFKLADFGLVRIIDSSLTISQSVLGTPAYMAPESFDGARNVDERSDIFSLGVIAYEIITGSHPFAGSVITDVVRSIRHSLPTAPCDINPKIPSNLQAVLAGMLDKRPERRYQTTDQVLMEFRKFKKFRIDFKPEINLKHAWS